MKSTQGQAVRSECRSAMLRYRSWLLRIMETFAFAPALLSGLLLLLLLKPLLMAEATRQVLQAFICTVGI